MHNRKDPDRLKKQLQIKTNRPMGEKIQQHLLTQVKWTNQLQVCDPSLITGFCP